MSKFTLVPGSGGFVLCLVGPVSTWSAIRRHLMTVRRHRILESRRMKGKDWYLKTTFEANTQEPSQLF